MGLTLLSLDWIRAKDPRTSLGHASLLARVSAAGHPVTPLAFAVNTPAFDRRRLRAEVLEALGAQDTLAIGVYIWNEAIVRWLLAEVRRAGFRGQVVLGGPQVSYAPPGLEACYPEADVFIRGYGEDALVAVLDGRHTTGVVHRNSLDLGRRADVDLAALPSPLLTGVLPVQSFMRWETQRGCPFVCSFCQHREAGARLQRRTLAPGRIRDEIDLLVQADDIAVLDPIFHNHPDAAAILRRFALVGYGGRLSLQCRFETLDADFLDACAALEVRLEFGLQTVQPSEMSAVRRPNKLERVEAAIGQLHARGIPFEVSLIYGLPTQTLASFQDSVRWCQARGVEVIRAFPLMLLRGTGLDQDRHRWRLVESDEPIPVVVESDTFTHAEWLEMRTLADQLETNFYRGAA